jgi:serine/threonine-protein kinase ATR
MYLPSVEWVIHLQLCNHTISTCTQLIQTTTAYLTLLPTVITFLVGRVPSISTQLSSASNAFSQCYRAFDAFSITHMATNESWVSYKFTTKNGLSGSAEPASSILAAQLPQLVSQGNSAHGYLTRETFSQLRQELVDGKCGQLRLDDSTADASRLICIVLQAGVEPCVKGDRFLQGDSEGQILDCLDIVQTILERSPQVLGEICDPTILGENASVPLYAWLILRLLSLLSWEANNIGKRIICILSSITRPHYKHITSLPSCYSALALLRACTNG